MDLDVRSGSWKKGLLKRKVVQLTRLQNSRRSRNDATASGTCSSLPYYSAFLGEVGLIVSLRCVQPHTHRPDM